MSENLAIQTNFLLDFIDNGSLPVFKTQVTTCNIPSVSMTTANIPTTPKLQTLVAGSAIEYDQMQIQYLMDENYNSYIQLYKWMISIVNPIGSSTLPSGQGNPSIAILHLLNSNRTDNKIYIKFYDVFPSNIGSIDLSQQVSEAEPVVGTATLNFKYFEIVVDGVVISPYPIGTTEGGTNIDNRPINGHPGRGSL